MWRVLVFAQNQKQEELSVAAVQWRNPAPRIERAAPSEKLFTAYTNSGASEQANLLLLASLFLQGFKTFSQTVG